MWNPFKPKTNTIVIGSQTPKTGWRRSMWVKTPMGLGIITQLAPELSVDLVDNTGYTIGSKVVQFHELQQATRQDIPESRRPSVEVAERLGY